MRNKRTRGLVAFLAALACCAAFAVASLAWAQSSPLLNDGRKWRIGYYEGGPYSEYADTMGTFIRALIADGWINGGTLPSPGLETPKAYWDWLCHCDSPYLSFREEDGYSANWDDATRVHNRAAILEKLKTKQLDLVVAMGTWAGQDLATNEHSVPTMVMSTSDPVKAGIIKSVEDSGLEHVTARVDPDRYIRQLRMFHRIVGFKTLGLAFEDTPDGRIYSAVSEVYQVAKERGFKVVTCQVEDTTADFKKSDRSCREGYRRLGREADAVYVTALACVDRQAGEISDILREARVPSFALVGSKYVREGIMMSLSSDSGYTALGRFHAMKFGRILHGAKPSSLEQVFRDPPEIAVNLTTVRKIDFHMPESILKIATEIYEDQ